ncbi:MAG: transporter [Ferruginibacter sp.]|nr:transporter [Ferruginibacter sp.]
MSETVIEVENISKLYKLGKIGSGSLRKDLQYWWKSSVLKKEDPYFTAKEIQPTDNEYLWALKDVSFEVKEGEALGIIGSNGSGKSTLLKIISRIVQPTQGQVRGRGKISSILEVGTGFHFELTGRENIYISGYTLGMNKAEILRKFDEIVAFSGIEKFLDTPVKRYSSGMYVRLAFAVAAHLEPDILIVDEVLAVGDADFQRKCMGKMQDISGKNGRTILFVSHNMQAITNLCHNAIWLQEGVIKGQGLASDVVESYLSSVKQDKNEIRWDSEADAPGNEWVRMKSFLVQPLSDKNNAFITVRTPIQIEVEFWCYIDDCDINVNVILLTDTGECVFNMGSPSVEAEKGVLSLKSIIPGNLLNNGIYTLSLDVIRNVSTAIYEFSKFTTIEVEDVRENMSYFGKWPGIIRPEVKSYLNFK